MSLVHEADSEWRPTQKSSTEGDVTDFETEDSCGLCDEDRVWDEFHKMSLVADTEPKLTALSTLQGKIWIFDVQPTLFSSSMYLYTP